MDNLRKKNAQNVKVQVAKVLLSDSSPHSTILTQ